jgi:hypothetical protein
MTSIVRHTGFNSFVWQQLPLFTVNKFLDFGLDFLLGITPHLKSIPAANYLWFPLVNQLFNQLPFHFVSCIYISSAVVLHGPEADE